jgi:hypothetical protein
MSNALVTVIVVPIRLVGDELSVWVERGSDGTAALPLAPLGAQEDEGRAVARLVRDLPFAGEVKRFASCGTASAPDRVKTTREIALVSWAAVRPSPARTSEVNDRGGDWHSLRSLPPFVDDHGSILMMALEHLQREILHDPVTRRLLPRHLLRSAADSFGPNSRVAEQAPILFTLLPDPFPLSAIRRFYESLTRAPIDRGNFRRKLVELRPTGVVKELPLFQRGVRHRAAQLFTFDPHAWERWTRGELNGNGVHES